MACGLTHIRRGTASTLKKVNNTRSQVLGNFILKREKRSDSSGGAENKSSIEMRESGITKAIDLGNPTKSSVQLSHSCASGHKVDFDDFKILSCCSDSYELMIHESLLINKYKPTLIVQGSSIPLNLF